VKRLLALLALAAASFAAAQDASTSAEAIKVEGTATPGALLFVSAPNGTVGLKVDGVPLAPAPDGRFLVGLPRDTGDKLVLEAVGASGRLAIREVAIAPRQWRVQSLPALGTTDTPTAEWQERREQEVSRLRAAKLAAAHDPGGAAGYAQTFLRPADGRTTGVYGSQRIFGKLARPPHWGLDIANAAGTPVLAAADGIVRRSAGPYLLEGNIVLIDHGAGLVSTYMHLTDRFVETGAKVKRGNRIGTIGTTGRSTGPHLHWGLSLVRPDGVELQEVRLDPALMLASGG
jgi:murein DD-endopeptidase MepM/ murein hydrolase activator NlpD